MTMKTIISASGDDTKDKNGNFEMLNTKSHLNEKYEAQKIRWLMLAIFICVTCINSIQWGQYVIISNLVQKYYGVAGYMVDNTTVVYMLAYIPLIFPALWMLEKLGIRFCLVFSIAGLCAGAWIKLIASFDTDLFYLVIFGQGVEAVFQVLTFGLAAKVSATWFAANEVSLACSLAVFGDQLGSAFGFLLPAAVVSGEGENEIGTGLINLNKFIAISATLILISALLFFQERPKSCPSAAQAMIHQQAKSNNIFGSIQRVLKKRSFIYMMLAYGILVASFNSYIAVLNSVFLKYFPDLDEFHIGLITFLMMIGGIIGSILFGWLLDKTHMYKGLIFFLYVCTAVIMTINIIVFQFLSLKLIYLVNILIGFFMITFYSVGIQLAIEITFPLSESIVSSLLLLVSHCLGIPFTKIYRALFDNFSDLYANSFICVALVIGCFLTHLISPKFRRTSVNTNFGCVSHSTNIV